MKIKLRVLSVILILCFAVSGCSAPFNLKSKYDTKNTEYISIICNQKLNSDTLIKTFILGQDESDRKYYFVINSGVQCEAEYSDYTLEKALEIINEMDIEEYSPEASDNGKIEYESIPVCLEVYSKANTKEYTSRYYAIPEDCALIDYLEELTLEVINEGFPESTNTERLNGTKRVFDYAGQLTDAQEESLEEYISDAERITSMDIVIVTLDESLRDYAEGYKSEYSITITPDKYTMVYANNFWEDNKFGYDSPSSPDDTSKGDGIILVDNLTREPETGKIYTWLGTNGDAMSILSSSAVDSILDKFYEDVDYDYYEAYIDFIDAAVSALEQK